MARAVLTLVLVYLALDSWQASARALQESSPDFWLFPVLRYGPSNQKQDFRQALALAQQLGAGLILTGLIRHYSDTVTSTHLGDSAGAARKRCFHIKRDEGYISVADVLDRDTLASFVPVATVEEIKQRTGWDGKIGACLVGQGRVAADGSIASDRYVYVPMQQEQVQLPPDAVTVIVNDALQCNMTLIQDLRKKLAPFKVVLVEHVFANQLKYIDISKEGIVPPQDACPRAVFEATRLPRPTAWIQDIADAYIREVLTSSNGSFHRSSSSTFKQTVIQKDGSGSQALVQKTAQQSTTAMTVSMHTPFLAVHVRPYPDTCLQLWMKQAFQNKSELHSHCHRDHDTMYQRLVPCVGKLLQQHKEIKALFVMAHPALHHMLGGWMKKVLPATLQPHFLEASHVRRLAGCHDNSSTFLMMVEDAIAVRAASFLGTAVSSITEDIVFQRLGQGLTSNAYLDKREDVCF